jgi:hypothetical protein
MDIASPEKRESKAMIWTGRVLSAIPVLMMGVLGGYFLIFKPEVPAKDMTEKYGYPAGSVRIVVAAEVACAVLYAIPQTSVLGAILLTGYLGGAVATHVSAGESSWYFAVIFGIVVWLGLFLRDARIRALIPLRS